MQLCMQIERKTIAKCVMGIWGPYKDEAHI
jgi:hypothetical protein